MNYQGLKSYDKYMTSKGIDKKKEDSVKFNPLSHSNK